MRLETSLGSSGMSQVPEATEPSVWIDLLVEFAESHVLWRAQLKQQIEGATDEAWTVESACLDDQCDLGRWLHAEGMTLFGDMPTFLHLLKEHREFHYQAAMVLSRCENGSWVEAEALLKGQFSQILRRLLVALTELGEAIRRQH